MGRERPWMHARMNGRMDGCKAMDGCKEGWTLDGCKAKDGPCAHWQTERRWGCLSYEARGCTMPAHSRQDLVHCTCSTPRDVRHMQRIT